MGETRLCDTYKGIFIFILCYLEPLQIPVRLRHDWDIFGKVAPHHSPGFILPAEVLGTITFILFVQGAEHIAASIVIIFTVNTIKRRLKSWLFGQVDTMKNMTLLAIILFLSEYPINHQ